MDINIFLMSNKSKLPSRLDLLNNIHLKAKSINEEEATKIMPILSMSKFYNPFLMTVIALPFTILIVAILLVIFGLIDTYVIAKIFGSRWIEGEFAQFLFIFFLGFGLWSNFKNTKAYNYNTLMEILDGKIPDNSFFKAYYNIAMIASDKADADKLEAQQNQPKEQQ